MTVHTPDLKKTWGEFIALGREGANADVNHPKRKEWEAKRKIIQLAEAPTLPFTYEYSRDDDDFFYVYDANGVVVARMGKGGDAEGRMFAAAPEMLMALQDVERLTTDLKILAGVRMAIAKATGGGK